MIVYSMKTKYAELGLTLNISNFIVDFETGMISAIKDNHLIQRTVSFFTWVKIPDSSFYAGVKNLQTCDRLKRPIPATGQTCTFDTGSFFHIVSTASVAWILEDVCTAIIDVSET